LHSKNQQHLQLLLLWHRVRFLPEAWQPTGLGLKKYQPFVPMLACSRSLCWVLRTKGFARLRFGLTELFAALHLRKPEPGSEMQALIS